MSEVRARKTGALVSKAGGQKSEVRGQTWQKLTLIVGTLALFSRTLALGGSFAPLRNGTAALGRLTVAQIILTFALGELTAVLR